MEPFRNAHRIDSRWAEKCVTTFSIDIVSITFVCLRKHRNMQDLAFVCQHLVCYINTCKDTLFCPMEINHVHSAKWGRFCNVRRSCERCRANDARVGFPQIFGTFAFFYLIGIFCTFLIFFTIPDFWTFEPTEMDSDLKKCLLSSYHDWRKIWTLLILDICKWFKITSAQITFFF